MPRAAADLSPTREPYLRPPTPRQLEILDYMHDYLSQHRVPPTFREMCRALEVGSPNGIMGHMKSMVRKGLVKQAGIGRHRAYIPVNAADCCPTCGQTLPSDKVTERA